ncbi:MAG: tRNA guanosine(34) transglycosylase Tgt, partial [Spirochaetes bacterium]
MLVTHHNLHFLYSMMEQARASIAEGRFMAFKKSFMERFRGMV